MRHDSFRSGAHSRPAPRLGSAASIPDAKASLWMDDGMFPCLSAYGLMWFCRNLKHCRSSFAQSAPQNFGNPPG